MKRFHEMADRWADTTPSAVAVIDHDGRKIDYLQLGKASAAAADVLNASGVRRGDRMLLVAENCFSALCFALAASRLDCWLVPVNARMSPDEISRVIGHAEPAVAVLTDAVSPQAAAHAMRLDAEPFAGVFGNVQIARLAAGAAEPVSCDAEDQVAALFYTTGTTGDPKGVMLTHGNLLSAARLSTRVRGCDASDHVLCAVPMTHVFGFVTVSLGAVCVGAGLQFMARFDEQATLTALAQGVTYFPAVPMMHARILEYARDQRIRHPDAPALKYVSAGGAPLDLAWKRDAERFYGLTLNNGYGITETSAGIATTRPEAPLEGTGVGPIMPEHEVRVVPAIDRPAGDSVGEIWVRGPNIMKGYYKLPDETAAVLDSDGFFHTGDLGSIAPDGTIEILGRSKELIIRSGFNVYPPEVEAALTTHPDVMIAAVIGHRQADGNEAVLAFIECSPARAPGEAELKSHAREHLAPYKVPTRVFAVAEMPRAATGKILKHKLADRYRDLIATSLQDS